MNSRQFTVCIVDYSMSTISLTLDALSEQLHKDFKVIVPNNGKSDLSFKFCQMFKRKHPMMDIDLLDVVCKPSDIVQYLKSGSFKDILLVSGSMPQLSSQLYLYDASSLLDFVDGQNIILKDKSCDNSSTYRTNAFYKDAIQLESMFNQFDVLKQQDILVSVVVASYNYEKFVGKAIESVLAQTYKNIEVVAIDDGSTDDSVNVINSIAKKDKRLRLLQHPDKKNHGLHESLKYAILKAKGEYIAFCESDDQLLPENIEKKMQLVKRYSKKPLIVANDISVFGEPKRAAYLQRVVDEKMAILKDECNEIVDGQIEHNNFIATFSSAMLKRSSLLRCDFDPKFECCTDWWLYAQVLKQDNHIYVVHEKLTRWMAHESFGKKVMEGVRNPIGIYQKQANQFLHNINIVVNEKNNISKNIYFNDRINNQLIQNTISLQYNNFQLKRYLYVANTSRIDNPYLDPSTRYRCFNFADLLRSNGHIADVINDFELTQQIIDSYDVFIFHRPNYKKIKLNTFLKCIKKQNKNAYADYDDLIFDTNYIDDLPAIKQNISTINQLLPSIQSNYESLKLFDNVIASTDIIAKHVKHLFPYKNVIILYNGLQHDILKCINVNQKITLNYKIITYCPGTASHNKDFQLIENALLDIINTYDDVFLKIIGQLNITSKLTNCYKAFKVNHQMTYNDFLQMLSQSYINIAPLEKTEFNNCKSGLKFFESGIFGVPTISMNCNDFNRFKHSGSIICNDVDGMKNKIIQLLNNKYYNNITKGLQKYCIDNCILSIKSNNFYSITRIK